MTTTDPLDDDRGMARGESDPNDSGSVPAAAIPTMSRWGMMVFGLLIVMEGLVLIRRKAARAAIAF